MSPNDVETLKQACRAGQKLELVLFWQHHGPEGVVGPHCLCQWYPSPFVVEGVRYATAEHYMMAEKARLFGDEAARDEILRADHPRVAQALGRGVKGFDGARWDARRVDIVVAGNLAKFGQDAALGAYLLSTGRQILVEASPTDRIWGIGLGAEHADARNPLAWRGLNLLGFALMRARNELRSRHP